MSCRGRPSGGALLAIMLLSAVPGCVSPTVESTVFADVCDGRLVLVLNLLSIVEDEQRFAIYHSDKHDLSRWTLAGTFGGRPCAVVVHERLLWVFFENTSRGRPIARTYALPGGVPGDKAGAAPGAERVVELPFPWVPSAACRDTRGALWVAGVHKGRIVTARFSTLGDGKTSGWDTSFPPGPFFEAALGEAQKSESGLRSQARDAEADAKERLPLPKVRISARDEGPYVFWSARSAGSVASGVRGALLALKGSSPRRSGLGLASVPEWRDLPEYSVPHLGFCAAPSSDGTPGLVLSKYTDDMSVRRKTRPHRVELGSDGTAWSSPEDVSAARQRFLFGYVPHAAWAQWGAGQLLIRTNTQRVEILERAGGEWRAFVPAGFLALYLTEIEVLVLCAGALLLVIVGGTAFGLRMRRLGKPRSARARVRPEGLRPLAPISRRVIAALLDVLVVSGAAFSLIGFSAAPAHPLVPDPSPLFMRLGALVVLAVYSALTEAAFGATPGKLAFGLRVELVDGGRPGFGRTIIRNLLRPVDLIPPYLGAVGLSLMTVTGLRQRLGDLVAGTVVVTVGPPPTRAKTEGDRR